MASSALRPEIASSWERAAASGLPPDACPDAEHAAAFDPSSRLLVAAAPVLDDLAADLDGSRYAIILADSSQRLIDLRYGRRTLRPVLEKVGAVHGLTFTESTTGTNSIATAFELRRGIAVHGQEHYLESFKRFACYGMPVLDPVTKRTVGVLDITCPVEDASGLLKPFLVKGARAIESRLLGMAKRSHRAVLDAFERAACRTSDPVMAFGDDLTLSNDAATEHLQPVDQAVLRTLAEQVADGSRVTEVDLTAGPALVGVARLDSGVVVRVQSQRVSAPVPRRPLMASAVHDPGSSADWLAPVRPEIARYRHAGSSVLVVGPTGTGRSSAARAIAGATAVAVDGAAATLETVDVAVRAAAEQGGAVLVEEVHLLHAAVAARLAGALGQAAVQVVTTTLDNADLLAGHVAGVVALCPVRLELPALRSRRGRVPAVAAELLRQASSGRACFTPRALQALSELEWPGNLRELVNVVADVAARRSAGAVTEADLPAGYRGAGRPRVVGALWQAERDAVVAALRDCAGNKVHAAEHLGISRTTLYRRLKVLRIDPDALRDRRGVSDLHT